MNEFILMNDDLIQQRFYPTTMTLSSSQLLEQVNKLTRAKGEEWTSCTQVCKGYHTCKYCLAIIKGKDTDVLCDDCAKTFGHSLYSEL